MIPNGLFMPAILICGLTLFVPLFLEMGGKSENHTDTYSSSSSSSTGLSCLMLVAATIPVPILMDQAVEMFFGEFSIQRLEIIIALISIIASFLFEFFTLSSSLALLSIISAVNFQLWLVLSMSLISLFRLHAFFSVYRILPLLIVTYIFVMSHILAAVFPGHALCTVSSVLKIIMIFLYGGYVLLFLAYIQNDFKRSKLSIWKWFQSVPSSLKWTLLVLINIVLIIIPYLLYAIFGLFRHSDFIVFEENMLSAYLILSVVYILFFASIPIRIIQINLHSTAAELDLKKSFVRYISHEIRTPLSIILTGIDVLEEQLKDGDDAVEILRTVEDLKQPCLSGIQLLNDLLEYEKLDSGLEKLEVSLHDPFQMLEQALSPFHMAARLKQVELRVENNLTLHSHGVEMDAKKVSE